VEPGPGYIVVQLIGATLVLRGRGGGKSGSGAAQGELFTEVYESGKS